MSIKDFYCVFVHTEMNLIAFSHSRNCVNTQYAALSGAMGEALKLPTKSGLTLRLAYYSAEVQRTFMLTYLLFMVLIKCHFPQLADIGKFSAGVGSVTRAPKSCRSKSASSPTIV